MVALNRLVGIYKESEEQIPNSLQPWLSLTKRAEQGGLVEDTTLPRSFLATPGTGRRPNHFGEYSTLSKGVIKLEEFIESI